LSRRIESLFVNGPAGRLEALLEEPETGEPSFAALVCHPHPLHGGTMHNKVVYRLARGLRKAGGVVLRFNYRGVNLSEGEYDHSIGETEDARAALGTLRERYPQLPYLLAGFSFGSRVVNRLVVDCPDAKKLIAAGFPTVYPDRSYLEQCPPGVERVFLHSTIDEFGPIEELRAVVTALRAPRRLILITAEDHFFAGALDEFEARVVEEGSLH
jgi:uncharacterized protein